MRDTERKLLHEYLKKYPKEQNKVKRLESFLARNENYWDRKNPFGHLTASGIVLSKNQKKILLIYHPYLEKWIQPGGHVEAGESSAQAALREVHEETACRVRFLKPNPIDVDIHKIPPNAKKDEGEHYHFDMRYLFVVESEPESSSRTYRWVNPEEVVEKSVRESLKKIGLLKV